MIFDLILAVLALAMLWYLLQMLFWLALWLCLQPIRLLLWAIHRVTRSWTYQRRPTVIPANVIHLEKETIITNTSIELDAMETAAGGNLRHSRWAHRA